MEVSMVRIGIIYTRSDTGYCAATRGKASGVLANLEEAVAMVLDANRELSAQSLLGAEVIREALILPAA
jgi:hypothetical protein